VIQIEPKSRWDFALQDKTFVSGIFITAAGLIFLFLYILEETANRTSGNLADVIYGLMFFADAIALLVVGPILLTVGATMGIHVPFTPKPARIVKPGDIVSIGGVQARVQKVRGSSVKVNGIWVSTRQIEFQKRDREN